MFVAVSTLSKPLADDTLLPLVSPVLLKRLHPHDISFLQRLNVPRVAIVIPRLLRFAVLKGMVLTISRFRHQQTGGCGQECLDTPVHQALGWAISRTLLWRGSVVEDSQVDISFRFLRSFNNQCWT